MTEEKQNWIPNLDELALRLQVESVEEPYSGVIMFGKSGNAYPLVAILANHAQFMAESLTLSINILTQIKEEGEKLVTNKKPRQSKKTDNPTGNPEVNQS